MAVPALVLALCAVAYYLLVALTGQPPRVDEISPDVGSPGDILVIRGAHFGMEQGDSAVRIGGVNVMGQSILDWTDERIVLKIPPQAKSGLVYVSTARGKSSGMLFTSKSLLPSVARGASNRGAPKIESISPSRGYIGEAISLRGSGFGSSQESSSVLFSWAGSSDSSPSSQDDGYVHASADDIALWSDQELRVIVPDGAATGLVAVKTPRGMSETAYLEIIDPLGKKSYGTKVTYSLSYGLEISAVRASEQNDLYAWLPNVASTASQRNIRPVGSVEPGLIQDIDGSTLYHFSNLQTGGSARATKALLVDVYEQRAEIKASLVRKANPPGPEETDPALVADPFVPAASKEVIDFAAAAAGKNQNPAELASILYSALASKVIISSAASLKDPVAMLSVGRASPAGFVALYCAMLRSRGVRSLPISGVVVGDDLRTTRHIWVEYWVPRLGWVPADPCVAAGLEIPGFKPQEPRASYYLSNLDNRHIAFLRGYKDYKRLSPDSTLAREKAAYSLQSIFEEASGGITSYHSFWSDISIVGVY
jgi:hypothetical protein